MYFHITLSIQLLGLSLSLVLIYSFFFYMSIQEGEEIRTNKLRFMSRDFQPIELFLDGQV
jgi:hypothetical protein